MDFLPFIEILLVRSTILIVLVGLVLFVLKDRLSANIRQATLSVTLLGLLLLPILTVLVPDYSIGDLFSSDSYSNNQQTSLLYLDSEEQNLERSETGGLPPEIAHNSDFSVQSVTGANSSSGREISFARVVFFIWSTGIAFLLLWLMVGILRIQHLTQTAKYSRLSNNVPWMSDLLNKLRLKRSVRVAYSDQVSVPMVWGLIYPTVLLPSSARQWGRARLQTLLLHEFAHIRRWDYLAHLLGKVVSGIYWMNPLVWFVARKMSEEQEKACDNYVLAVGTPSYVYAQHMLDFMKWLRQQNARRVGPAMTMGFKTRKVKERMQVLLDETTRRKTVSFASLICLSLMTGCAVFPLATLNRGSSGISSAREMASYVIEAESTDFPKGIRTEADIYASGEKFIRVKDDLNSRETPPDSGRFSYTFRVAESGVYGIWGRTKTDDGGQNSFWVRMDGGAWIQWNKIREGDLWRWNPVHDSQNSGRTVLYSLDRGEHTLELAYREENIALDKLLITSNINYRPDGKDPVLPTRNNEIVRIAAASGRIESHFRTRKGDGALYGEYLSSTRQKNELDEPPTKADVVYTFRVSKDGNYQVWARVMAESGGENSFWIRVDEKPWVLLNGFSDNGSWSWEQVYDYRAGAGPVEFELNRGNHIIEIAHRERNARLDEIVITDAPGFYPRAHPSQIARGEITSNVP